MALIVGISGVVYDFVCHVHSMPRIGETVLANGFKTNLGGKVANSLVQASLLGDVKTSLIGKIGNDQFGKEQIENLRSFGVETENVKISSTHPTSTAFISIDKSGANQIVLASGADQTLSVEEVTEMSHVIEQAKVLLSCFEVSLEVCAKAFSIARKNNISTLLVPAPLPNDFTFELLPEVDILCANEIEAGQILGLNISSIDSAKAAVKMLFDLAHIQFPIITLGEKGAVFRVESGSIEHISAPNVIPIDTTGAGDSFVGCLAHRMATVEGASMTDMVKTAVHVASMSTKSHGTRTSYVTKIEI